MRIAIVIISICFTITCGFGQQFEFNGSMSEQVLRNYLSRSISMQRLLNTGFSYANEYNPTHRSQDINMLVDLNAKFIGRATGLWSEEDFVNNGYFAACANLIGDINNHYDNAGKSRPIIQAAIFESVSPFVNTVTIPSYVAQKFGISVRNFNYDSMLYSDGRYVNEFGIFNGQPRSIPDITKSETRMWFYYLATQYIDIGFEAFHMGQVEKMAELDTGYSQYNWLFTEIRGYAQLFAARKLVLLDAHTNGFKIDNNLLFDFHSQPTKMVEDPIDPVYIGCGGNIRHAIITEESFGRSRNYIYNNSIGGKSPLGWETDSNPYLVELDNYDSCCPWEITEDSNNWWYVWGKDEITWFRWQPSCYRDEWLKYAYYQVKCIDDSGHFQMPGRRSGYRAFNTQEEIIKEIWNKQFNSLENYEREDFTDDYVSGLPNVQKNLVPVGNNRIYYIGTDQRIRGYIYHNNSWQDVSPSSLAGSLSSQVKAAGDLVSNPSGTALFYRGVDGLIYTLKINTNWSYTYSSLQSNIFMDLDNIESFGSLIMPTDDRLYYLAYERSNSSQRRVYGAIFSGNSWSHISPSILAGNVNNQVQALSDLISDPSNDFLYYKGLDSYVYRFQVNSNFSYTYSEMPTNSLMQQEGILVFNSMVCASNDRIYYIASEIPNNNERRIHGFVRINGVWTTASPTYGAGNVNSQQLAGNRLAVSKDGATLVYSGNNTLLYGFNIRSYFDYDYFSFGNIDIAKRPTESIVFDQHNNIYYIASGIGGDNKMHRYRYQPCGNIALSYISKECVQNDVISSTFGTGDIFNFAVIDYIHSNSLVEGNSNINYDAGNEVELQTGFEVASGARFHAYIDGCPD